MTPERAKELLPIIEAYANGAVIQYHSALGWEDCTDFEPPEWIDGVSYRIKPKIITKWVNVYFNPRAEHTTRLGDAYDTKELAKRYSSSNSGETHHVIRITFPEKP